MAAVASGAVAGREANAKPRRHCSLCGIATAGGTGTGQAEYRIICPVRRYAAKIYAQVRPYRCISRRARPRAGARRAIARPAIMMAMIA
eukprot:SAG22_NODE_2323_length_2712_cov_2.597398_1_plen_88_part_10